MPPLTDRLPPHHAAGLPIMKPDSSFAPVRRGPLLLACTAALLLGACASVSPDDATGPAREWAERHAGQTVRLGADARADQTSNTSLADELLARPLDADGAVRLALQHSPATQALLAESWARQSAASAGATLPNPVLRLERAVQGDVVELGTSISFGLLELLTLPQRQRAASRIREAEQLQLAQQVLVTVQTARQQWVRAVAAAQARRHLADAQEAADTGAELARRLEKAGNTSRWLRLREESGAAEARGALARATHAERAEREALVRLLGLNAAQAARLQLPPTLPPVPADQPVPEGSEAAPLDATARLDLLLARARWQQAGGEQSADAAMSWTDLELGLSRTRTTDEPDQRGIELGIRLPIFDLGSARRSARSATERAAAERFAQAELEAASQLREQASALRGAWQLARHQIDEQLPRQQQLTEETLLRYNGMLISVFELLAQARTQAASTAAAIDAQRDYWLADAAWQAARIGVPGSASLGSAPAAAPAARDGGH